MANFFSELCNAIEFKMPWTCMFYMFKYACISYFFRTRLIFHKFKVFTVIKLFFNYSQNIVGKKMSNQSHHHMNFFWRKGTVTEKILLEILGNQSHMHFNFLLYHCWKKKWVIRVIIIWTFFKERYCYRKNPTGNIG